MSSVAFSMLCPHLSESFIALVLHGESYTFQGVAIHSTDEGDIDPEVGLYRIPMAGHGTDSSSSDDL